MGILWVWMVLSLVFSDIYICKMKKDVLVSAKRMSYKRYVDDTYIHRQKNINDGLFQNLNCYQKSIIHLSANPIK